MGNQVVIFGLGQEEYGMPIEIVREITRLGDIRPIPKAPDCVKGLINLRGSAIPLIDLHVRFGVEKSRTVAKDAEAAKEDFALITEVNGELVGFAVDQVREVRILDNIAPPPPLVTAPFIGGIVNLPDRIIMVLIPDKILDKDELEGIAKLV
ncbi:MULTISPECIES: chemotaxis protein CheW [Desulfitobacterium]|uniref:Chemotaxis signal transduction protein n=2 Tax=Desulfitobacterium dehalogenans TaxID=36854 RepID=I4ACU3_DESDJ|nr:MULTISPECIES: chemotaxis protein CheW [Desulfitobacterium]AFM01778.1 chemotaxis signal transduction protein [Desulfitobacterium dehalogenans ATCC 51507]HHY28607.1 purine-binding chemotaxis protein CheW [Desulfitobacterium dehalogenans]